MAGRVWSSDEDTFLRENHDRMTAREIADVIGRTEKAVHTRRVTLSLPLVDPKRTGALNSQRWRAALEARLSEPLASYLKRRYETDGASYRELTAELSINTRSLMSLMEEFGIAPIDGREAVKRQLSRNPAFLESFIKGGQRIEARFKTAVIREQTLSHMSDGEFEFLEALHSAGFDPVPQLAVESYNIDFAFPDIRLAVEWDARWHRSPRKRPTDTRRDIRLSELGWTVLRLDPRTSLAFNIKKVSEARSALASTHPR